MGGDNVSISVVLAVYNGQMYLKEAIDSILSQTFADFEFIIIDDGSTDSTSEIILNYSDPRIVYLKNETNKGLIYSLNRGLSVSKGKYIARMDSDDIALPKRFRKQYDYMESHPETGICGSNVEAFFNTCDKKIIIRFPKTDHLIRTYTFFQPPFSHPSVMMRRKILIDNHLKYSEKYLHAEDYALWVDLLKYTKAYNIPAVLLRYRIHEKSVTAGTQKDRSFINPILIQEAYFRQNNMTIALDDAILFSRFVNRYGNYDLNRDNQKIIDRILKSFFIQLFENKKDSYTIAEDFVSSACFLRFFRIRKYPATSFLRRLYWRGIWAFTKKTLVYLNRFITRS
jgi:glycosyltransferase involved in cell wall biosynthesis